MSQPSALRYQYWLEGIENDWAPVTANTRPSYSALSSGSYTLHARAVGQKGITSEEIIIPFDIRPPFYFTWWFITLMILAVVFIIFQVFQI